MGRTIAVGDIHGCYDELAALLEKIGLTETDRVVAVGDLIVKGNKNSEVLRLFSTDSRFSSVIGNQDLAVVRFWQGKANRLTEAQKRAVEELEKADSNHFEFLASLPLMLDLGSHLVVHAGLRPGIAPDKQSEEDLTELRTLGPDRTSRTGTPWYEDYDGEKVVIFGHWPATQPRVGPRAIGLDTGCVYGGRLTAYIIQEARFLSVGAAKAYDSSKMPEVPGTIS